MSYFWPGDESGLAGALARGAWCWEDEFFRNNDGATAQFPGWVTITSGTFAALAPGFVAGDVFTRGYFGWRLTASPVAPVSGWRRTQGTTLIGADGYSELSEVWVWARFRMETAKPAVSGANGHFASPFGLAAENAGPLEPVNGMGLCFDPTLGVDQFVWRVWRAGVADQIPVGIAWDNDFHFVLAKHRGANGIEVFTGDPRAGVPLSSVGVLNVPEIQPAAAVLGYHALFEQLDVALAFNPQITMDVWGIGGPGPL